MENNCTLSYINKYTFYLEKNPVIDRNCCPSLPEGKAFEVGHKGSSLRIGLMPLQEKQWRVVSAIFYNEKMQSGAVNLQSDPKENSTMHVPVLRHRSITKHWKINS